jgi:hypothetical protein
MNPITKRRIAGEMSWTIATDQVALSVTERGGHMAPVTFYRNEADPVQPYYLNPWRAEGLRDDLPLLDVLRGDFFCMPFGGANAYRGERHPVHGESANAAWRFVSLDREGGTTALTLALRVKARPGTITKRIALVDGHPVVYCRHVLDGFQGPMCLSHHATLALPEREAGLRVSSSPIRLGRVAPRPDRLNRGNEYYFLEPGSRFASLSRVSTIWKEPAYADCSRFPLRYGYMDLAALYAKPTGAPAWIAASVPSRRYVWFALKDPRVLPQTVLWMSNGGRHAPPWNGRNRCLGLEDGCGYFASGLEASARANDLNQSGIATALRLTARAPTAIHYIQGVAKTPKGFGRVRSISFEPDRIALHAESGIRVEAPVRWPFVLTGRLQEGAPPFDRKPRTK